MKRPYLDPNSEKQTGENMVFYETIRNLNTDWLMNDIKKLL